MHIFENLVYRYAVSLRQPCVIYGAPHGMVRTYGRNTYDKLALL